MAYQQRILKQIRVNAPVIVVGNLSVGGSGKTPLIAHIAQLLLKQGYQPGIISRGYKGTAADWPQNVTPASDPDRVGDEPVMLAALTRCPVMAGPDRADSAQQLIDRDNCNVILSDDGFQHLKLARDIDVLVFDTSLSNGLGNGWCLPSGPLRESPSAREQADMQVMHGSAPGSNKSGTYPMILLPGDIYELTERGKADIDILRQQPLHAIAGIGNPGRFFENLRVAGLTIIEHAFDDHHSFTPEDFKFDDEYDFITTEKDAIKLMSVQTPKMIWVLPVHAKLGHHFDADLLDRLERVSKIS